MTRYWNDNLYLQQEDTLAHYGVLGMHWGVRRYQNYDGSSKGSNTTKKKKSNKSTSTAKKVAIAGAAVVGTALAAYGAYKINKLTKSTAKNIINEYFQSAQLDLARTSLKDFYTVDANASARAVTKSSNRLENARRASLDAASTFRGSVKQIKNTYKSNGRNAVKSAFDDARKYKTGGVHSTAYEILTRPGYASDEVVDKIKNNKYSKEAEEFIRTKYHDSMEKYL